MIASLRRFKGIYEFAKLAEQLQQYRFELILASDENETEEYRKEVGERSNLSIYACQTDLHPFYQRAKLLLQLSHPEACVETFGLTILEAMAYGIPAIVPDIGGPIELIENGKNGYCVNPHDINDVTLRIRKLMEDNLLYKSFSQNALRKAKRFREEIMINEIENYINQ